MHHNTPALVRLLGLTAILYALVVITAIAVAPEQTAPTAPTAATEAPDPIVYTPEPTNPPEIEPTTEPNTEPEHTYTDEELEMLALVIYQEAGADYCSDETRLMVGTVVMNRIADPRYPDTMYEVITARLAYGKLHWTGPVWPERASKIEEAHAVARAYIIAERILQGERAFGEDVVFQSEHIQGTEIVAYSDGIYFCR